MTGTLSFSGADTTKPYRILGWDPTSTNYNGFKVSRVHTYGNVQYQTTEYSSGPKTQALEFVYGNGNPSQALLQPSMYLEKGMYHWCRIQIEGHLNSNDDGETIGEFQQMARVGLTTNPNATSINQCKYVLLNYTAPSKWHPIHVDTFVDISNYESGEYFWFFEANPGYGYNTIHIGNRHYYKTGVWLTNQTNS